MEILNWDELPERTQTRHFLWIIEVWRNHYKTYNEIEKRAWSECKSGTYIFDGHNYYLCDLKEI